LPNLKSTSNEGSNPARMDLKSSTVKNPNGLLRVDLTPYSLKFTDIEVTIAAVSTLVTTALATPIVEERYKIFVQIASGIGPLSLLSFKI